AGGRGGRCPEVTDDALDVHVEGTVRLQIGRRHPVLRVGEGGDLRHDVVEFVRRHDSQLHLDVHLLQRDVVTVRMVDGRGGLAAVDDLQIVDPADDPVTVDLVEVDLRRGGRDAVVV